LYHDPLRFFLSSLGALRRMDLTRRVELLGSAALTGGKLHLKLNTGLNQDVEINLDIINNNGTQKTSSNALQNSPLVRVAMGMGAHVVQEKSDE
jgi:hypothetical protein